MKHPYFLCAIFLFAGLSSCTNNEEPDLAVFMQPSSIQSTDANADNQTFEYDDYGRIVSWKCISKGNGTSASYSAHYSYPDANTIKVIAEEVIAVDSWSKQRRSFEETISLANGRASKSEGTLSAIISTDEGETKLQKTYRLEFGYLPTNHLNIVRHSEVLGIGAQIDDEAWSKAWTWENYLIWEDGNLKEFQDFQGNSSVSQTTKYEYSSYGVAYPVVIPTVINSAHHLPLFMQGVFGLNSENLVASASTFDHSGTPLLTRQYSYELDQALIIAFTETLINAYTFSNPITYKVNWTEK